MYLLIRARDRDRRRGTPSYGRQVITTFAADNNVDARIEADILVDEDVDVDERNDGEDVRTLRDEVRTVQIQTLYCNIRWNSVHCILHESLAQF